MNRTTTNTFAFALSTLAPPQQEPRDAKQTETKTCL